MKTPSQEARKAPHQDCEMRGNLDTTSEYVYLVKRYYCDSILGFKVVFEMLVALAEWVIKSFLPFHSIQQNIKKNQNKIADTHSFYQYWLLLVGY